jgi:hypothetical protein
MNDYPTSREAEKLLRRTNQFLASSLPAWRITEPQVKMPQKKAQSLGIALQFHQRRRGGGDNTQTLTKLASGIHIMLHFKPFHKFFCAMQSNAPWK